MSGTTRNPSPSKARQNARPQAAPAATFTPRSALSRLGPDGLLAILLAEFAGLVLLWVAWEWEWPGFSHDHLRPVMYGVLPLVVPYFGALGGLSNAMLSVVWHWKDYDSPYAATRNAEGRTWSAWTVVQAVIGAIFGTVASLIVVLITKTITLGEANQAISATGMGVLAAVSFAVGFRQQTFQKLVTKVVHVITGPGETEHQGKPGS